MNMHIQCCAVHAIDFNFGRLNSIVVRFWQQSEVGGELHALLVKVFNLRQIYAYVQLVVVCFVFV